MSDFRINFELYGRILAVRNKTEDMKFDPKVTGKALAAKYAMNPIRYMSKCFKFRKDFLKSMGHDIDPPKPLDQEEISDILNNIEDHKSYYVASTLCVDNVLDDDVLVLNLDGSFNGFKSGVGGKLSKENWSKLVDCYKEHKIDKGVGNEVLYEEARYQLSLK